LETPRFYLDLERRVPEISLSNEPDFDSLLLLHGKWPRTSFGLDWVAGITGIRSLRHALYHMARMAMKCDAHFSSVYAALRAKGLRHGQALRNIGDRLLRVLMAMLRDRTCYDASRIRHEPVVQMG
jgi:hypothetical protein